MSELIKRNKNLYVEEVLKSMPRLLCMINRNEDSMTYGCCDRNYWHYKTSDFPNVRFQEAVLTLVLIYNCDYRGNIYYKNGKIKKLIGGILAFFMKIQHPDGSFDELYKGEKSFGASAFAVYAVSEAIKLMKNELPGVLFAEVLGCLKMGARWLNDHEDECAINQDIVTLPFFKNMQILTGDPIYNDFINKKISYIKKNRSEEGWFYEYNGADFGYLSVAISYLGEYFKLSNDSRTLEMALKAIDFFNYFVSDNGYVGGEYGSRNTSYLIPNGFEVFASKSKSACKVLTKFFSGFEENITPSKMDDKYFSYCIYCYLQAYNNFCERLYSEEKESYRKYFNDAKLIVIKKPRFFFVANLYKGGVFRLETRDYKYSDCGIAALNSRKLITTQWLDNNAHINIEEHDSNELISVSGSFYKISESYMTTGKLFLLRLLRYLNALDLKRILRKKFILKTKKSKVRFKRTFLIKKDLAKERLTVIDEIFGGKSLDRLKFIEKGSFIHVASSKYFHENEANLKSGGAIKERGNYIKIVREFEL